MCDVRSQKTTRQHSFTPPPLLSHSMSITATAAERGEPVEVQDDSTSRRVF